MSSSEVPIETLADFFLGKVRKVLLQGDADCFVDSYRDESVRYSQVEPWCKKITSALAKRGFKRGDTLIQCSRNTSKVYVFILGVWKLNGVIRCSYPEDVEETIVSRFRESRSRFILCDPESAENVFKAASEVEWDVQVFSFDDLDGATKVDDLLLDDGQAYPEQVEVHPDDFSMIFATSGTTGESKGTVHTVSTLMSFFNTQRFFREPSKSRTIRMIVARCYHAMGIMRPYFYLSRGDTVVNTSIITPEEVCKAAHKYKPSWVLGIPSFVLWLASPCSADYDFSSIKTVAFGGASITEAQIQPLQVELPNLKYVFKLYASGECLTMMEAVDFNLDDGEESTLYEGYTIQSVGKPYKSLEIKLLDLNTGEQVGVNEVGEVCIRGPMVFKEYIGMPEETAKAKKGGWFHTGDLFYYDKNGFYYFVDRAKETFKHLNYHISPTELEGLIEQLPGVKEVCVVGVPAKKDVDDYIPRAYIVREDDCKIDESTVKNYIKERLADYKQLEGGVSFVKEIPKGNTGKVNRKELIEAYKRDMDTNRA